MQYYSGYQINTQCGGVELRKDGCDWSMFFQAGDDADTFMTDWHQYVVAYGGPSRACAEMWSLYENLFGPVA